MKILACLLLVSLLACASQKSAPTTADNVPSGAKSAQWVVNTAAGRHEYEIVRLTLHAVPTGGTAMQFVASTMPEKIGKASDPEDIHALETGEVVVLHEGENYDITVPIADRSGRFIAVAGVTLLPTVGGQDAARANALMIAGEMQQMIDSADHPLW